MLFGGKFGGKKYVVDRKGNIFELTSKYRGQSKLVRISLIDAQFLSLYHRRVRKMWYVRHTPHFKKPHPDQYNMFKRNWRAKELKARFNATEGNQSI